jgi:hypothetical protein
MMNREELLKNAKPILFNTEMVQAILDGRKRVTRRVVKPQPNGMLQCVIEHECDGGAYWSDDNNILTDTTLYKSFEVGNILYVRETWSIQSMKRFDNKVKFIYKACGLQDTHEIAVNDDKYIGLLKYVSRRGWQPSLFMPKEAARIFLKVTDVKVERLQDITEEQAIAEGFIDNRGFIHSYDDEYSNLHSAKEAFIETFLKIYPECTEECWFWVIEFERCEKPEMEND